jgi:hypothetical protein
MSEIAVAALAAVGMWLAILSVMVLVLVRQLAVITVRLTEGIASASMKGGLTVGMEAPQNVRDALPELRAGPTFLLLTSATCGPCQELVSELGTLDPQPNAVALLPGHARAADALHRLFPAWIRVIRDPEAYALSQSLQIDSTPFGMALDGDRVVAKAHLKRATDFALMIESVRHRGRESMQLEVPAGGN